MLKIKMKTFLGSTFHIFLALLFSCQLVFPADTDPKLLIKCMRILKKINVEQTPLIPSEVKQINTGASQTAKTYTEVSPSNLAEIFKHQFKPEKDPNLLGAKGIVYRGVDGELKVVIWPTGEGPVGNSIHHRDAVASILQAEAKALEVVLHDTNNMKVLMLQDALSNLSEQLSQIRTAQSIPDSVAERFFGFQMTAVRNQRTGALTLKHVDLDSSLTSVQTQRGIGQTIEETQAMMDAIGEAISPEVKPESFRIEKSHKENLSGFGTLHGPQGSRLEILP